jgi:hypothetical protein
MRVYPISHAKSKVLRTGGFLTRVLMATACRRKLASQTTGAYAYNQIARLIKWRGSRLVSMVFCGECLREP